MAHTHTKKQLDIEDYNVTGGAPFGQHVKVEAMAITVVELLLKLAQMKRMTLEQPPHPYELFVKTEMKKQQVVQTATTDQGLQVKVLVFQSDLNLMSRQ